jgi:hypothetical protein
MMIAAAAADKFCWGQFKYTAGYFLKNSSMKCLENSLIPKDARTL